MESNSALLDELARVFAVAAVASALEKEKSDVELQNEKGRLCPEKQNGGLEDFEHDKDT